MAMTQRDSLDVGGLNLGGNTFGWTTDQKESFAVLDTFVELGGNFIDTADSYSAWVPGNSGGESESIIGDWMAERGNRATVVVATKVGQHPEQRGLARENVETALAGSLARLRSDYIDLYYAHSDDESIPIIDQVRTFDALVSSGRVRHIGLSNYSPQRMREFFETARREALTEPVAIQPLYNLVARRSYEREYAPIVAEYGVAVFPYYALASGFLTGKYRAGAELDRAGRGPGVERYMTSDGFAVIDAVVEIAQRHDVEPATVALAWLLAKEATAPIASATRPDQLPALLAATALELTAAEVDSLDDASATFA